MTWNKYYAQTYDGSMVGAGFAVFAVWGYVIANMDWSFHVKLNPTKVALLLGGPVSEVEKAIKYLCSPDKDSRSKEHDGRRLIEDGVHSYTVVNGDTYRYMKGSEELKEYNREKQAESRERRRRESGSQ